MPDLVLTDVDEAVLRRLAQMAHRHGASPAEEAKAIIIDVVRRSADSWAEVDAIFDRLSATGKVFSDSAELLREDRDR